MTAPYLSAVRARHVTVPVNVGGVVVGGPTVVYAPYGYGYRPYYGHPHYYGGPGYYHHHY